MPWFIKQETFSAAMTSLSGDQRRRHCDDHRRWVEAQRLAGCAMASGFLVDDQHKPGGGGLLAFEAESFEAAKAFMAEDPMISRNLVDWTLHEWKPVEGELRA